MANKIQRITPFLWFHDRAEEAVAWYMSIFDNSRVERTTRYTQESAKASGRKEGSIMTIAFQLAGQDFTALNGGPEFELTPAISLVVNCETQEEIDHYWQRLGEGGDPKWQQCGWLQDKFGVTWQVVPTVLPALLSDANPDRVRRTTEAMLGMKKLDIDALRKAAAGT